MTTPSPTTTEWEDFSENNYHHIKKFRGVGDNVEIKEQICYSKDQHNTIVEAERVRASRFFSMPDRFTKYKNPIVSHVVQVQRVQELYFIHISTVVRIRYVKMEPMAMPARKYHLLD